MITDLLKSIAKVGKSIYDQVQLAKANKKQCQLLEERLKVVLQAISGLDTAKNTEQYKPGLIALEACLNEALTFITQFSQGKGWLKKILKAGSVDEQFKKINEKMQLAVEQLHLGLGAQQIMDRELDRKAQQEDAEQIHKDLDEIIKLNIAMKASMQKLNVQQQDQHNIIMKQCASMKREFLNRGKDKPAIEQNLLIPFHEFEFDEEIGRGSFGTVYLGNCYGEVVALKSLEGLGDADYDQFVREVQIMSRLRSPHIVQIYGASLERENLCLSMEYMDKGSLQSVIMKGPLSAQQQKSIILNIAQGLSYIHRQDVVHCDLRSANVLLNSKGQAKITDFGLSKANTQSIKGIKEKSQAIEWQAPECLKIHPKFSPSSDVFALGMIIWEITTGKQPFSTIPKEGRDKIIMETILSGKRETIPSTIAPIYQELIEACWEADPCKRPTLNTIMTKLEAYEPAQTVLIQNSDLDKLYEEGMQLENQKKYLEAFQTYKKATELGHIKAQTNMGFCYSLGKGIGKDLEKALQCFTRSANANPPHPRAMTNLALMYEYGKGSAQDLDAAMSWYLKAAKLGDEQARMASINLQSKLQPPKNKMENPKKEILPFYEEKQNEKAKGEKQPIIANKLAANAKRK